MNASHGIGPAKSPHSAPSAGILDRQSALEWYRRNRARSAQLFDMLSESCHFSRPIALRNPIVFYEGHLPGFSVNTVIEKGLGRPAVDAHPRSPALDGPPRDRSARPAAAPPSSPVTKMRSPGRAPERSSARPRATEPTTVTLISQSGELTVSPRDERAVTRVRKAQESGEKPVEMRRIDALRHAEREQTAERIRAHRAHVRQVHGERLRSQRDRVGGAPAEVHALDERVRGQHQVLARPRAQDRRVVADAEPPDAPVDARAATGRPSRMEGLGDPGTTYLTEDTFKLTEGFFRFEALGEKKIKGKEEPVKVYQVIAPSTRRTKFDVSAERGLTPFVGRERELELLLDGFERVKVGKGQAFSIISEAGVGKSRLLYEFRKAVANEDVNFLEGKCLHTAGVLLIIQ